MDFSNIRTGLTYDDVLLVPKRSAIVSRKDPDTTSFVTKRIKVKVPIISANTDTVTESEMAMAMAQLGAIGIIHRFMTIQDQVDEVRTVKSVKIAKPVYETVDSKSRLMVGGAVGIAEDLLDRASALLDSNVDFLLIDIAHGHSDHAIHAIETLRKHFPHVEIMAGNVATAEGAIDLVKAGASAIKVGIGPGSVCKTRMVTGCGVPQLTAVVDCAEAVKPYDIPIVADGGIKYVGDITKALAAGASTIMTARLLQGTEESASFPVIKDGMKYKISRGVATIGAKLARQIALGRKLNKKEFNDYVPEGVESMVPYQGTVAEVVNQLTGGLRSGMSYCGASNLVELRKKAEFIKITPFGMLENVPRVDVG